MSTLVGNESLFILTGMSGAGKSTALRTFEDHNYFCIDNLPPSLIATFLSLYRQGHGRSRGVAVVCDVRSGELFGNLRSAIEHLEKAGEAAEVIFFDCADEVLVARFAAARRNPPLGNDTTPLDAVRLERRLLDPLGELATHTIDTTELSAAQLRERVRGLLGGDGSSDETHLTILTFGYKHGVPADADFVFDTRFLPNPFYVDTLRPLSGKNTEVRDFLFREPLAEQYLDRIEATLNVALEHYSKVGKSYAVVAMGCTGGRHRSVCLAEELAGRLGRPGVVTTVQHRDVDR